MKPLNPSACLYQKLNSIQHPQSHSSSPWLLCPCLPMLPQQSSFCKQAKLTIVAPNQTVAFSHNRTKTCKSQSNSHHPHFFSLLLSANPSSTITTTTSIKPNLSRCSLSSNNPNITHKPNPSVPAINNKDSRSSLEPTIMQLIPVQSLLYSVAVNSRAFLISQLPALCRPSKFAGFPI
ncbi:hypothetical protein M0R45_005055 [Rubus argutus]|uniref:Uncharacterized protein n=1 Tax=Rubus argutus TaxID=59490 RepID=A0AAW1YM25_RUBAR